jgi:hypothetical protein
VILTDNNPALHIGIQISVLAKRLRVGNHMNRARFDRSYECSHPTCHRKHRTRQSLPYVATVRDVALRKPDLVVVRSFRYLVVAVSCQSELPLSSHASFRYSFLVLCRSHPSTNLTPLRRFSVSPLLLLVRFGSRKDILGRFAALKIPLGVVAVPLMRRIQPDNHPPNSWVMRLIALLLSV